MPSLNWPDETARPAAQDAPRFVQAGSNICLDFHGDPARAKLAVFSDGNHHMALQETLQAFVRANPEVDDVFYCTTPPGAALQFLRAGCIDLGNLRISVSPHVFISPPSILDQLVAEGRMHSHRPFAHSRGIVLLVRKGNPQAVTGIKALLRPGLRLFLSNPVNEKVSYETYTDYLRYLATRQGLSLDFPAYPHQSDPDRIVYGEAIHHREAPQALADGRADVAVVFHHMALRYQRIFPELFEFVRIEGENEVPAHGISSIHCGLIRDGGAWGVSLLEFLRGKEAASIYGSHGLTAAG